ncbi:MAG: histidine phosphatase family protein [Acidobacteria bacterium]|nr:histidine phosphatase family protein [Acidobacteriota bacterium]
MNIYLIRSAEASPLDEKGELQDDQRPLTEAGQAQAERLAITLQHHNVPVNLVVSSPVLRARQTADLLLENWSSPVPPLQVNEYLSPDGKAKKLTWFLQDQDPTATIALIGHGDFLINYAAWLIGDEDAYIRLAKGGLARITFKDVPCKGGGALVCLLPPEWLAE